MGTQRCLLLSICMLFFCFYTAQARQKVNQVNNFIVRENLIKNDKLAIIACDSAEQPTESVNGNFLFVINGFQQNLQFHNGVAIAPQPIEKSVFVFLKHKNEQGSHGKLFYILKSDGGVKPIQINWIWLVLIPLGIILLIYLFKRLIIFGIIILVALFYFNYSKGLNLENLLETIVHGIKGLIG